MNSAGKTEISQLTPKKEWHAAVSFGELLLLFLFSLLLQAYKDFNTSPLSSTVNFPALYPLNFSGRYVWGNVDPGFHLLPSLLRTQRSTCDPTEPAPGPAAAPGGRGEAMQGP